MTKNKGIDVAMALMQTIVDDNKNVGLTYEKKDGILQPREFFTSLEAAQGRISDILINPTVVGLWVGTRTEFETELGLLLRQLHGLRGFGAASISSGMNGKVYDIWF